MRLLHVTPTYAPAYRYGGPIYSVHALCKALAAAGHEVHVVTTSVDGPGDSDVPYDRPVDVDGVQVHYCRSRHLRRLYWSGELQSKCVAMASGFDAVHLHSVFLFPTWAAARAASNAGVPYVLSPRGMLVRELIDRRSALVKKAWIGLIERRNLAHAAVIHLTAQQEQQELARLGLALAPTLVIPNGVDAPAPAKADQVSGDVRALIDRGVDVLSLGRINWKKALDRLVRAIADVPGATAIIAGPDEDGEAQRLRSLAVACGVENRMHIVDRYITAADKEALFAAARVFAMPSLSENFGNVVAEAMVRGVPVIVSDRVGAAEVVTASGCGIVTGGAGSEIARAITELLASPRRRQELGMAGNRYARTHLAWERVALAFADLYARVATPAIVQPSIALTAAASR